MQTTFNQGSFAISTERYRLAFPAERPYVLLQDANGQPVAELFSFSSVHTLEGRDDTVQAGAWQIEEEADEVVVSCHLESSLWREKEIRFRCRPLRFSYEMAVGGEGQLAEVHAFGGYYSASLRWGSGFFLSGHNFSQGFTPEPNGREKVLFSPAEGALIDLMGVPLPGRDSWFFTPPPFCFVMQTGEGWLGMGVEARAGENHFTEYRYHGQRESFYLTLNYEGQTRVNGWYELPAIGFDFCTDRYEAIAAHADALRSAGLVPVRTASSTLWPHPLWWRAPIFSGWGAQCHLARQDQGQAQAYCRQAQYTEFMAVLADNQIEPGIVVIDDKWQEAYGLNDVDREKWPDLAGFIADQHGARRKVLLWLKLWDPEGVPAEECVTNAAGLPVAVDPGNPHFAARLQAQVAQLLGSEGCDADGFKIDFSARTPSGPAMHNSGTAWGLELMKQYLQTIYEAAKAVKPEALIMTHTPHPYLADVVDMIRLNDINTREAVPPAMRHRARIAAIACPDALIDTDNWPIANREMWRSYLALQTELGIPSLYYTSHVDTTGEALEAEDYQLLRESWARYRSQMLADANGKNGNGHH